MQTLAAGSLKHRATGFTLLELLVVVAIVAMVSAAVGFAMRDSFAVQLEREAQRLSALLESARAQSRDRLTTCRICPLGVITTSPSSVRISVTRRVTSSTVPVIGVDPPAMVNRTTSP